jgi:hypothetical protein
MWSAKIFAKPYIWRRGGGRDLPPWATAVGVQSLSKENVLFCLNSDGCKFYMKIVAFDKI